MNLGHLIAAAAGNIAHAVGGLLHPATPPPRNPHGFDANWGMYQQPYAGKVVGTDEGGPVISSDPRNQQVNDYNRAVPDAINGTQQLEQQRRQAAIQALTIGNINAATGHTEPMPPQATVQGLNTLYQLMYGGQ